MKTVTFSGHRKILDKKNKVWYTYFEMEDTNGEKL